VDFKADTSKTKLNEIETTQLVTVFASLVGIVASRRPDGRGRPSPHKHRQHQQL